MCFYFSISNIVYLFLILSFNRPFVPSHLIVLSRNRAIVPSCFHDKRFNTSFHFSASRVKKHICLISYIITFEIYKTDGK